MRPGIRLTDRQTDRQGNAIVVMPFYIGYVYKYFLNFRYLENISPFSVFDSQGVSCICDFDGGFWVPDSSGHSE